MLSDKDLLDIIKKYNKKKGKNKRSLIDILIAAVVAQMIMDVIVKMQDANKCKHKNCSRQKALLENTRLVSNYCLPCQKYPLTSSPRSPHP